MGKMVFIFPILDKVDVFVHESGGKVGKNTPSQLTTNSPWDFVVLDLKDLIRQNCEVSVVSTNGWAAVDRGHTSY